MLVNKEPELKIIKSAFFISSNTFETTDTDLLYFNSTISRLDSVISSSPIIS